MDWKPMPNRRDAWNTTTFGVGKNGNARQMATLYRLGENLFTSNCYVSTEKVLRSKNLTIKTGDLGAAQKKVEKTLGEMTREF